MEFDAFTIVAQLLNFALILFVLKRFLYKPLIEAMDEREASIEERLEDAEALEETADARAREFATKLEELDDERTEQLAQIHEAVERENRRLHHEMKERVQKLEADWRSSLKHDARMQLEQFRDELASEVLATVRAALSDLATRDLEEQLVARFVELVQRLDADVLEQFKTQGGKLRVVTAHPLDEKHRARLERALAQQFGDTGVTYDIDPGLVAGIELRFAGHRLGWSIDDYLDTLEGRMKDTLREADHGEAAESQIEAAWNAEEEHSAGNAAQ